MTIEEKAKAYDKALEIAKKNYDAAQDLCNGSQIGVECFKNTLINIFSELGESEDEKIRKDIIDIIKSQKEQQCHIDGAIYDKMITWLEKQGEQKVPILDFNAKDWYVSKVDGKIHDMTYNPTDKVEPKFKVGDWIVKENIVYHIDKISGVYLTLSTLDGRALVYHTSVLDNDKIHLWTIADAKDGDVLVNGSNIFIFHFINNTRLMGYCHINTDDGRFYDDIGKNECFCLIDAIVNPATKEQRDLLFQKMKEAGYEWNAEKKELKLLITNGGDFEQKQEWSEEDEEMTKELIGGFLSSVSPYRLTHTSKEIVDWLDSVKCRMKGKEG